MSFENQNLNREEHSEGFLPYVQLRYFVESLLRKRVKTSFDVEDISQEVFRRSWQWATRNRKNLSIQEWKAVLAKIVFNEINRFYTKKIDLLSEDLTPEDAIHEILSTNTLNPQFIFEIAEELRQLPFRQRLSLILYNGEILPYLKVVLPDRYIAELLEINEKTLLVLESKIPLSDAEITEVIEMITQKECKSSIRDERCKGRKFLKRRLFGK